MLMDDQHCPDFQLKYNLFCQMIIYHSDLDKDSIRIGNQLLVYKTESQPNQEVKYI